MIVTPQEIATIHRYDEEELPFITDLIKGAEFFLYDCNPTRNSNNPQIR
nr:MAG TPA: hypothetical protein [Caudoviricetes sp.]